MDFDFLIERPGADQLNLSVSTGGHLFVLGANGAGKSALMHRFYLAHRQHICRISAHRQNWFDSGALTLSPAQKRSFELNILNEDNNVYSRWKDSYSAHRPSIALHNLLDAENIDARAIAEAVRQKDVNLAVQLATANPPIAKINELLKLSNLSIEISVYENEELFASKAGSEPYSIAELSDGERSALLLAASVLTARENTLFLIDEPERHLHRSIASPLLTLLFAERQDCAFVVSTHEISLAVDHPDAQVLLLRSCTYENNHPRKWNANLLQAAVTIDDEMRRDILGSRSTIVFVEGTETSLDKPLYSLLFPEISVVSKNCCRDVEQAVRALRGTQDIHWLHAFGIIDRDGRSEEDVADLKLAGTYALSVFSVEAVYYHPELQRRVAERHAQVVGGDVDAKLVAAETNTLTAIQERADGLVSRVAEKRIRDAYFAKAPNRQTINIDEFFDISIDIPSIYDTERQKFDVAVRDQDLPGLFTRYPVDETRALHNIVTALQFESRSQYETSIRTMLMQDQDALEFARSLFGTLYNDLIQINAAMAPVAEVDEQVA